MNDCIVSTYSLSSGGYARVKVGHKYVGQHRVAYCEHNGVTLDSINGLDVLHTCDNPSCINGKHLFLGTALDNMRDKVAKGRWKGHHTEVSKETVDAIRAERRLSVEEIKAKYSIGKTTLYRILNKQGKFA